MEQAPAVIIRQEAPIRSLSLHEADLRKLLEKVQERCWAAAEIEVTGYNPVGLDPTQLEKNRNEIREGFRLFVSVVGVDGTQLHGSIETIFGSPNLPDDIQSVFFDSGIPLKNKSYYIANRCLLSLDFSRPDVLDFSFMPSQRTPNASNVEVQGRDATWVNGVFHEITTFVRERSSTVPWLHRHSVYDVLLWLLGFPLSFWVCYRLTKWIDGVFGNPFLRAAVYVYLFMATLTGLRVLFHYARWIWPLVEYRSPKSRALGHKFVWVSVALAVFANFVTDLVKRVLG